MAALSEEIELEYIVLRCHDLAQSAAFFTALGADVRHEQHGRGAAHHSCRLGSVVLELYPLAGQESKGVRLGLRVSDVRQIVDAVTRLGGEVVRFAADAPDPSAVLRDPDGHEIAISERSVSAAPTPTESSGVETDALAVLGRLVDGWCERRALGPLAIVLRAYPMSSPLSDGWRELRGALRDVRRLGEPEVTDAEAIQVEDALRLVEATLTKGGRRL